MEANRKSNNQILIGLVVALGFTCSLVAASTLVRRDQQPAAPAPATTTELPQADIVTAKTTSGLLRGTRQATATGGGQSILKFLGVPYAEAPIGQLRFKRPQELAAQHADRTLNASQFGKTCAQFRHLAQFISPLLQVDADHQTSEDCLQLNLFVPANVMAPSSSANEQHEQQENNRLEPSKQLPVIVWLPGEGFDFADARQFDGTHLALKTQSIVVTVQYRVGVFGFLQAPKLNISGNMGIYDQLMALRWVRKNIDQFGGDSERVTLMGRFSGSMAISAMITAPEHQQLLKQDGRMLFQRAALLSGIAVDDWIIDAGQQERVRDLEEAALVQEYCTPGQVDGGNCLEAMSTEQLMRIAGYGWRLVRDNELIGERAPIDAIKLGSAASTAELEAILLGETKTEGTLCLYRHALDSRTNYAQLIEEDRLSSRDLYNIIRDDSQTYFRYPTNKTNPIEMALGALIESASGEETPEVAMQPRLREKYLSACSAYMVKSHSERFKRNVLARNQQLESRMDASKKPTEVYHYELRYKPSFSLAPDYIKKAAHGDDIPLIFGLVYNQPSAEINEADLLMTRKMMSYVGNFVHGNQPLLSATPIASANPTAVIVESRLINDTAVRSMDEGDDLDQQPQPQQPSASVAVNVKARSWANEGQLNHIELDESDLQELDARRRQHHQHHNRRQSSNALGRQPAIEGSSSDAEQSPSKSSGVSKNDGSVVSIRLVVLDGSNINQQAAAQQKTSDVFVHRRGQQQQSANLIEQQQQSQLPPSQQTNMTLINESSFVTMLLFGTCLMMFALMFTCLGLCLIIFRGSLSMAKSAASSPSSSSPSSSVSSKELGICGAGAAAAAAIQHHHHQQHQQHHHHYLVNSSASSCNICDESQANGGNTIEAVLGGANGKDARAFSNVFAKLRNNQAPQANHHQPQAQQVRQSQQQQQQPIESPSCKHIE